jgi:hypothetical protein
MKAIAFHGTLFLASCAAGGFIWDIVLPVLPFGQRVFVGTAMLFGVFLTTCGLIRALDDHFKRPMP